LRSIHGYRQDYYPADDFDLECRLAEAGNVLVVREPLVAYRFHATSNTYQVFANMRQKMSWTRDSYHRRSQNLEELTFDQFLAAQPKSMVGNRIDRGKLQMRMAGQYYLDGRYLRSAGHLLAALTLDPKDIVERVRQAAGLSS
jgi:hypothetical protein